MNSKYVIEKYNSASYENNTFFRITTSKFGMHQE